LYLFLALFGRGDARYCLGSIDDYLHVAHFWGSRQCFIEIGKLGLAFRQIVSFACAMLFFASMSYSNRNNINSLAFSSDEDCFFVNKKLFLLILLFKNKLNFFAKFNFPQKNYQKTVQT
jgi:hypothetical protein